MICPLPLFPAPKPKAMKSSKLLIQVPLVAAAMALSTYTGYRVGEQSAAMRVEQPDAADLGEDDLPGSQNETPNESKDAGLSPEELAKAKGVPAVIPNPDGDYTLMSVIEGAAVNQKLTENLQLVVLQRQQLASLATQFNEAPVSAVQQRELIAGQINEVRNALTGNLQFMAQNYGYTFENSYLRIPHQVSLVAVDTIDGKTTSEIVHEFKTAEDYAEFQKKNDDYLRSKMELANAADAKAGQDSEDETTPAEDEAPNAAAEVATKRDELIQFYHFDPERQYNLQYQKTAFYARAAR